jgi:hypothetical protein
VWRECEVEIEWVGRAEGFLDLGGEADGCEVYESWVGGIKETVL